MYQLLSSNRQNKLKILLAILKENQNLASLMDSFNFPKRTTTNYIHGINEDMETYYNVEDFIQIGPYGDYNTNKAYREKRILLFHQLKLQYLQETLSFQVLHTLTTRGYANTLDLMADLHISESYLHRIIGNLNFQLKNFNVGIKRSNFRLLLTGPEENIRIFSFQFLTDSFHTLEWPFSSISEEELSSTMTVSAKKMMSQTSPSRKRYLLIFLGVVSIRLRNKFFVSPPVPRDYFLIKLMKDNYDMNSLLTPNNSLSLDNKTSRNEDLYFNFSIRFLIPSFFKNEHRIRLGQIFSEEEHPSIQFARAILKGIRRQLNVNIDSTLANITIYYLTLFHLAYSFMGDTFHHFFDAFLAIPEDAPPYEEKIVMELTQIVEETLKYETNTTILNSQYFISALVYYLSPLVQMNSHQVTTIYFQFSRDFTMETYLKVRLSMLFSKTSLVFTDNYPEADIVVSDTLESPTTDKFLCYFNSLHSETQWNILLDSIRSIYQKKNRTSLL